MQIQASPQLTLVAATLAHLRAELDAPEKLAVLLDAEVSSEWPPGEYDRDAMEFFRTQLEEGGAKVEGWYGWYAIREADEVSVRALVGGGGYLGPPDGEGTVEIGYSLVPRWRRRGYAGLMVAALVARAFTFDSVARAIAHTTEENVASVAVLLRCGFERTGAGRESGTVRFERER